MTSLVEIDYDDSSFNDRTTRKTRYNESSDDNSMASLIGIHYDSTAESTEQKTRSSESPKAKQAKAQCDSYKMPEVTWVSNHIKNAQCDISEI